MSPLLGWLFREALRANGMVALDLNAMRFTGGIGISLALLLIILLLAFWLMTLQFAMLVIMVQRARVGAPFALRSILGELGAVARKLWRPSSLPLFFYLFLVLPLSGFGFVSLLSQGIAVPSFISGELLKSPTTATFWYVFIVLLVLLNLRFALSLPLFVLTDATGGKSMRMSWQQTAGLQQLRLALAVLLVLLGAAALTVLLLIVALAPTAISDEIAPQASPVIAAFSLGAAQLLSMLLTITVTAFITVVLNSMISPLAQQPDQSSASQARRNSRRVLIAGSVTIALGLGFAHIDTMQHLSQQPQTLILGHRGFSTGGVENTIEGLEAAAAVNADLVEIDVLQTKDKRFVVMHDADLKRLTGIHAKVKDLTLNELTQITVRDEHGHEGKIPSLAEYITHAHEIDMPLLIEIKLGGLDTPDHVDLLIEELDALHGIDGNIFHTLDHASVERVKRLRPDASVGYILPFAGADVPETSADFIVIEQFTATEQMQQAAERAGLGFFSWTVNDRAGMRELLRRDADGIITDHPDLALGWRQEMHHERGLAGTLLDALTRFIVVF